MRLSAIFLRIGAFVAAALIAMLAATATVAVVEDRSAMAVKEELVDVNQQWASVVTDGLQVILEGTAPTEAARFRVISAAGRIVDATRVIDSMSVVDADGIAPPQFAIEILRNDSGVSLIGLIPADDARDTLMARVGSLAAGQTVTDLLDAADYPVPDLWRPSLNYALRALEMLPRSKISVTAGRVDISAISDSPEQKAELEAALIRNIPDGVARTISITAPRPVISPFTTRFVLNDEGARLVACAVDDLAMEKRVIAAAAAAGFTGRSTCVQALGMPSRTWDDAVVQSIDAVRALGGGSVTLADTDVTLTALEGTSQALFDRVVGELENSLPDVFALKSELPIAPDAEGEGPPQFTITLSPEGDAQLRGRVPDDLVNLTAENYAAAKFGQSNVTMGTRVVPDLPQGWSVRVLAGIEALSSLTNGAVTVRPEDIIVSGRTGNANASTEIASMLVDKLGQATRMDINVEYVEALDPLAGLPTPDECIAQITAMTQDRKILFDPGSASITSDSQQVVDDIAEILQRCANLRIQIAGYTDSQGGEDMNQQLSQQRASAVLDALRMRRVPISTFTAVGFGEDDPIADNDTADGREANRRIEFSLIRPESTADETNALDALADDTVAPTEDSAQEEAAPAE